MAFLLASLGLSTTALAHLPLNAPRVALSLALDWNQVVLQRALAQPRDATATTVVKRRHTLPKLSVTGGPVAAAPSAGVAAYGRFEQTARAILMPRFDNPAAVHTRMLRAVYLSPYAPYFGCYGAMLNIQSDALLR